MKVLISVLLLAVLSTPAFALSTSQTSGDSGITIRANVSNGVVLDPGDQVAFRYQTARDGVVVVFDIDTQGYVSLLHDEPLRATARDAGEIPNDGSELFAEGEPGVEFVFAVSVADLDAIDTEALASLRDGSRRIDGDPFVAANMITAELVRNISRQTVSMGYTYFYVSNRVEYPCYLCGTCDGSPATEGACDDVRIVQNFDRRVGMTYPLERGYDMVDLTATDAIESETNTPSEVAIPDGDDDVNVNFYPYGSEVHYADPMAVNLWYDYGMYDPFYWYYPYSYPYCSPWSFSIGFGWGWGWGWGGGYYCSGWYDPWCGGGYYPGGGYPDGGYSSAPVKKFKSTYKGASAAPTLAENRKYAARKDGELAVGTKGVRTAVKSPSSRSKSALAGTRFDTGSNRVKTSVSKSRNVTREAWAKGRSGSAGYRGKSPMYRSKSGTPGKTVRERSGAYRSKSGVNAPSRSGSSRSKSMAPSQRGIHRPSGNTTSPRMKSNSGSRSAPAYRGGSSRGSSWGGSRGAAGGARGGGGGGRGKGR